MILDAYKKLIGLQPFAGSGSEKLLNGMRIRGFDGVEQNVYLGMMTGGYIDYGFIFSASYPTTAGIHLGSGNTAVTPNDYCLAQRIGDNNISVTGYTRTISFENNIVTATYNSVITNNSGTDYTAREWGLVASSKIFGVCKNTSGNNNFSILIERALLDTPIELPAGESVPMQFTKSVDFSDLVVANS